MSYDEDLADRIRELAADEPGYAERRMFGGLAFLIGGHMAVAASGRGGLMVRVALRVAAEGVRTRRGLEPWVNRGVAHARALPPKA